MKALSVRQPFAYLIVHGVKTIENRTWPTAFRGRIYIHASKSFDYDGFNWLCRNYQLIGHLDPEVWAALALYPPQGIVGEVDIVDCITQSDNPWFTGKFGWVLSHPVAYDQPIPYKGKLGLFEVVE